MKRVFLYPLLLFFCFTASVPLTMANHIVGGEVTYRCINDETGLYEVNLVVYRDCEGTGAEFDDPAYLFVYSGDRKLEDRLVMPLPSPRYSYVDPPEDICIITLPDVCVQRASYKKNIVLPPNETGYTLVYQRYSRNNTLRNIRDPGETGSSYTATIPASELAICNSSPVFKKFPPTVICADSELRVDQSAIDAEGDSLVYYLCDPLEGGSLDCVQPGHPEYCGGEPAPPPPYRAVRWRSPYSKLDPIGGSPPLNLDPITGQLVGFPSTKGQFVVGVCVDEYRNGELIGNVKRDFQFNVTDCTVIRASVEANDIDADGSYLINDCQTDLDVQFLNNSINGTKFQWDFGDPTSDTDISTEENPLYEYPDTGTYYVRLIADTGDGTCVDTANIILYLYPILRTDFDYAVDCGTDPAIFTDRSTSSFGEVTGWEWDFGDGNTSTEANPQHIYGEIGGEFTVTLYTTTSLGCVFFAEKTINVKPSPLALFQWENACVGEVATFTDDTRYVTPVSWSWDFGDPSSGANNTSTSQNTTHVFNEPGVYTINFSVVGANGCSDYWPKVLEIYPAYEVNAGEDAEICAGGSVGIRGDLGGAPYDFEWVPTAGLDDPLSLTPTATPTASINYTLKITDPNGCTRSDIVRVTVNELPVLNLEDQVICKGESVVLQSGYTGSISSFLWTGGGISNNQSLDLTVSPEVTTTYLLAVTNEFGCSSSAEVTVEVIEEVNVSVGEDIELCVGDGVVLQGVLSDNVSSFSWSPSTGLDDPNSLTPTATPSGDITYTLVARNDCFESEDALDISINSRPDVQVGGNDLRINVGETVQLDGGGAAQASWSPVVGLDDPNTPDPFASPLETTTYYLSAVDPNGCVGIDSVTVFVDQIFEVLMPTAFSPNNDGVNDEFYIIDKKGLRDLKRFAIYNRWGQQVFETNEWDGAWDGASKFLEQQLGVYVYYIQATTYLDTEFVHKGNISLIR